MYQFINGSNEQFTDLEARARQATVVFSSVPMPTGVTPPQARIGFEVDPGGTTTLLVDRDVQVSSEARVTDPVRAWLASGRRSFPSFDACAAWIRTEVAPCYRGGDPARDSATETLTDIDTVRAGLRHEPAAAQIDERALYESLTAEVRGQDAALRTLARLVALHTARRRARRPRVAFAVGPTGVGKTRAAEVLAEALRSQEAGYAYVRLDMSEYQERHRVSQLLGAPAGYVGYGDGSVLLDALQSNPRTVVHFDEIEKAHPDILKALMNAMDAGRLSRSGPGSGERTVDCRSALFYFTSNLDCEGILEALAERADADRPHVVDAVCRQRLCAAGMAPELVGRIHGFLVFHPLSRDVLAEVAALAVARVAEEYGLSLAYIEPPVLIHLLREVDDGFGVRPLEYLADALFGSAFAKAARSTGDAPVKLVGPPFRCRPRVAEPKPGGPDAPPPDASLN